MLPLYNLIARTIGSAIYPIALNQRAQIGKEDKDRLNEKKGIPSLPRPDGTLYWIHGASVGEAQSALILIKRLLQQNPNAHILVTTGTFTSANYLENRLPERCFHQYYPWDHPKWVSRFLDHWNPNAAFWIESEIWPAMLMAIQTRNIPAALINARLSEKTANTWAIAKASFAKMIRAFDIILTQNETATRRFRLLEVKNIITCDNIKYSAAPLPCNPDDLNALKIAIGNRPTWLYASTHAGEEELAANIHQHLKKTVPDILTVIVPRHPARTADILKNLSDVSITTRDDDKNLPDEKTDIYIANTMGELGLFYALSPIACIGRSFSNDGGGGHNPIEPAHYDCAILSGPSVQFQQEIFDEMVRNDAVCIVKNADELGAALLKLFQNPDDLKHLQQNAKSFATSKMHVIDDVLTHLAPVLEKAKTNTSHAV
jgi:3-deoxy-D-manno-octulosonic-acid transferase